MSDSTGPSCKIASSVWMEVSLQSFSSGSNCSNLLAIDTGDQKGEHSKGSFYITPLDGKNIPGNIHPSKETHDNFQINLVGVATLT